VKLQNFIGAKFREEVCVYSILYTLYYIIYTHTSIYPYTPIPLYIYTLIHLYPYTPIPLYTYTLIHLYPYTPIAKVVFTKGATDAINIVAQSWTQRLVPGDEIILSVMEHHANLVPWQMAAARTGAVLKFVQLTPDQQLDMVHFQTLLSPRTKLVSISHASNVLGSVNPVEEIISLAHAAGALVLLDACQVCYDVIMLLCYYVIMLLCYYVTMLLCYMFYVLCFRLYVIC
jgi:histidinol-phosphate/aromatic aminotransferase/cobyric acid decarboxylase-like protein